MAAIVTSTMTPGEAIVQAADELERALENELGDDPAVLPRVWAKAAADWLRTYAVEVDVEEVRQRAERALLRPTIIINNGPLDPKAVGEQINAALAKRDERERRRDL